MGLLTTYSVSNNVNAIPKEDPTDFLNWLSFYHLKESVSTDVKDSIYTLIPHII